MKDNDGNTALHLAVKNRDESIFGHLVGNRDVKLNLVNGVGYTPLDLASKIKIEKAFSPLVYLYAESYLASFVLTTMSIS